MLGRLLMRVFHVEHWTRSHLRRLLIVGWLGWGVMWHGSMLGRVIDDGVSRGTLVSFTLKALDDRWMVGLGCYVG